jgi:DNA anti-recombination protein RmuC
MSKQLQAISKQLWAMSKQLHVMSEQLQAMLGQFEQAITSLGCAAGQGAGGRNRRHGVEALEGRCQRTSTPL